jgi:hypothetical protein
VFKLEKNEKQLSFSSEKENSLFGDGSRILFWIDLEMQVLQRGRQEYIPLDTISGFMVSEDGNNLCCNLNGSQMLLYQGSEGESNQIREAVQVLNEYCSFD